MKKILLAAIVVLFVASAYAQTIGTDSDANKTCTYNGQKVACQWKTGCWFISQQYSDISGTCSTPNCTCNQLVNNCINYGTLYSHTASTEPPGEGGSCPGSYLAGRPSNVTEVGCCSWETERPKCWPIFSDSSDVKIPACRSGGNAYWSTACPDGDGTCPGGTPEFDGRPDGADNCGHYCRWNETGNCEKVSPDPTGEYGDATSTCDEAKEVCISYGELYRSETGCTGNPIGGNPNPNPNPNPGGGNSSNSNSGNGGSSCSQYDSSCNGSAPIITLSATFTGNSLIAMQNAVNLQVKSTATLRIYDMKGKIVRAQKIEQGNHVVQLQLPRGLYIIKATSGSWKETIKVTVK